MELASKPLSAITPHKPPQAALAHPAAACPPGREPRLPPPRLLLQRLAVHGRALPLRARTARLDQLEQLEAGKLNRVPRLDLELHLERA